ncbi:MAG TPA: HD domain-containing protein [Burkholderiales bacterium]|nr:HD domain-containing protein [Burkholderiales bacterium]
MHRRGNEYDVSCQVNTTDSVIVNSEVDRIFVELYPKASTEKIDRAFHDLTTMYRGGRPGYHACDTAYHDIQHVLEVTLATARLIDGYERTRIGLDPLDASMFRLGVITALFHDCGYIRTLDDRKHKNGGELTLTHVSRGARFLRDYLPKIGMGEDADVAAALIHFTGYEIPVAAIRVPSLAHRLLGSLLGSADIIAQMSDRCYLEKCRDRLYPEFVAGGIARRRLPGGNEEVVYRSGDDLVRKTPNFYRGASRRLDTDLGGTHKYAQSHFGGQHLYMEELTKNIEFAQVIDKTDNGGALKRNPPTTQRPN